MLYTQLPDLRTRAAAYAGPAAGMTVRAARTKLRGTRTATLSGVLRFADSSSAAGLAGRDPLHAQRRRRHAPRS